MFQTHPGQYCVTYRRRGLSSVLDWGPWFSSHPSSGQNRGTGSAKVIQASLHCRVGLGQRPEPHALPLRCMEAPALAISIAVRRARAEVGSATPRASLVPPGSGVACLLPHGGIVLGVGRCVFVSLGGRGGG